MKCWTRWNTLATRNRRPVQAGVIPLVLDDFDVIGQARTGTGKTAAFAIPILEMLDLGVKKAKPQALILAPTRELAVQVENEFKRMSNPEEVRCCCLYGGRPIKQQCLSLFWAAAEDLFDVRAEANVQHPVGFV